MNLAFALEALICALNRAGVRYLIGGSLASSAQGLPRATLDVDLLVEIQSSQASLLAGALGCDWYIDADFARQAVARGISFNVIHMPSGHKFDLFPAIEEFHFSELNRSALRTVNLAGGDITCFVATAEDMILAKLSWYRKGGEVSDRQWSDIAGMLVVNRQLDRTYLEHWARRLQVTDLLEKAITDTWGGL